MIADGASLRDVLDQLCSAIDVQVAPSVTTILLMDADGKRLCHGGGLRVPREWISTITPVPVAFDAGLCGTAAFLKTRVIVPDVATEPNWPDQYRDLAIRNGIRAAWSEPILNGASDALSRRMPVRFSWMKSVTCPLRSRLRCYGCSKNGKSNAWVVTGQSASS